MNFIERLVEAAKKYPEVERIRISRHDLLTIPREARDGGPRNGWPAAWAIAKEAGVSWGCGNTGRHQLDVPDWRDALPSEYVLAEEAASQASDIASTARMIADTTREAIAQEAVRKAVEAWQETAEAQAMITDAIKKEQQAATAQAEMRRLRPAWVYGYVEYDITHDAPVVPHEGAEGSALHTPVS